MSLLVACPNCGSKNQAETEFPRRCVECGTPIPDPRKRSTAPMGVKPPLEHIVALTAEMSAPSHALMMLLSDYASAYGYIAGSEPGRERLLWECRFWKAKALGLPLPEEPS